MGTTALQLSRLGPWPAVLFGCGLVGVGVAASPLIVLGLAVITAYVAISLISPRLAVLAWLLCLSLIPTWFGAALGGSFFQAATVVSLGTVPALVAHRRGQFLELSDLIPTAIVIVSLAAIVVAGSPLRSGLDLVFLGVIPYLIARLLAPVVGFDWLYRVLSVLLGALALWAILEYTFGFHPFTGVFAESPTGFWSEIQLRGGAPRSEVTFGHAIALGGTLAMAIPLALGSTFRTSTKLILITTIGLGILATASRGPLLAGALGVILMLATNHNGARIKGKGLILVVVAALTTVFAVSIASRFSGNEAVYSASYRTDLYEALLPTLSLFGAADSFSIGAAGASTFQGFTSIDSAYLQIGLTFGLLALALVVLGLSINFVTVLAGRSSPAGVALAAQIPLFATVWLITQYYPMAWFLVGLTVAAAHQRTLDQRSQSTGEPI